MYEINKHKKQTLDFLYTAYQIVREFYLWSLHPLQDEEGYRLGC
jgi:hypothetical protein